MKKNGSVEALSKWGHAMAALLEEMESGAQDKGNPLKNIVQQAARMNPWFVPEYSLRALKSWSVLLGRKNLEAWLAHYSIPDEGFSPPRKTGIVMAGNIPLVGFHDLLCVLASGHTAVVKYSADDRMLIPFLLEVLRQVSPEMFSRVINTDRLEDIDAVIATGSNNTSRYFEHYFGRYPHIIRKSRTSVAVLTGEETEDDLRNLGDDIFSYFGLGCRNVSKLYVPRGYDFAAFFRAMESYGGVMQHNKYMNNYDYHSALFLLNNENFLTNNFLLLREHTALATPVSVLHYEAYSSLPDLRETLQGQMDAIQCIVGSAYLPFGSAQQPGLLDYADGTDTMKFLLGL